MARRTFIVKMQALDNVSPGHYVKVFGGTHQSIRGLTERRQLNRAIDKSRFAEFSTGLKDNVGRHAHVLVSPKPKAREGEQIVRRFLSDRGLHGNPKLAYVQRGVNHWSRSNKLKAGVALGGVAVAGGAYYYYRRRRGRRERVRRHKR